MSGASRYHAVRKIADGGSAEVFLGEQQGAAGFRRPVVLKRIRPALWADEQFREMLLGEAQLAMSLHHPNLVEVLDVGESGGRYFLVLELVDGWTLGQVARRGQKANLPLPPELCVYVAAEVCRGLSYAHQRTRGGVPLGVVHRDVCPNNVLVSMHADVKVTDFGIARASTRSDHTRSGMIRGKPMYMSPEQARGEPLDARSDLFSVGTVLYQLLTGQLPFSGPSDQEYLAQISNTDAPSPATLRKDLPRELCRLVEKAMARKRDARFASAQELLVALEHVQRTALRPAGRSELEAYLRALSARDGETPILKQTLPPAPPPDEPEWISLSAEQALVEDQTATEHALPHFRPPAPPARRSGSVLPVAVVTAALVVAGAWAWSKLQRGSPPAPVSMVTSAEPAPPAPPPPPARPTLADELAEYPGTSTAAPVGGLADASAAEAPGAGDEREATAHLAGAPPVPTTDLPEASPPGPPTGAPLAGTTATSTTPTETAPGTSTPPEGPTGTETARAEPASRSGTATLRLSARLAPGQQPGQAKVGVVFESEPPGVAVRVDKRQLGTTPATLHFRNGLTYDVWFEAPGQAPVRQWLMLTERAGKLPRVTLRDPVEAP